MKLFLFFRPLAVAGTDDKLELNKFTGSIIFEDISPEPDPDEDPTLFMKLLVVTGRISTSLISSEVTELSFNSCIPFKKYIKDFTVWNCSDLPTVFRLRSTSMTGDNGQRSQPLLEFTDYETGETLSTTGGRLSLDGFSNRRLRVTFQPVDVEEVSSAAFSPFSHCLSRLSKTLSFSAPGFQYRSSRGICSEKAEIGFLGFSM